MKDEGLEPARSVIKAFGGHKKVAEVTGAALNTTYDWKKPKEKRGTGGLIPAKYQPRLLAYAVEHGLPVTAADLIAATDVTASEGAAA